MTDSDKLQLVLDTLRPIVRVLSEEGVVDMNTNNPALLFRYAFQVHAIHTILNELLSGIDPGQRIDDKDQSLEALRLAVNAAIRSGNSAEVVVGVVRDQLLGIEQLGHGDPDEMLRREASYKHEARDYLRKTYPDSFKD